MGPWVGLARTASNWVTPSARLATQNHHYMKWQPAGGVITTSVAAPLVGWDQALCLCFYCCLGCTQMLCLLELPWMFPGSLLRYHEKIQGSCCHSVALRQLCTLLYRWALLTLLRLESGSRPVDPRCCHEHVLLTELCKLCWTVLYFNIHI